MSRKNVEYEVLCYSLLTLNIYVCECFYRAITKIVTSHRKPIRIIINADLKTKEAFRFVYNDLEDW